MDEKKVLQLEQPPRLPTGKNAARAYMLGQLTDEQVAEGSGGIYRAMRIASSAKSEVAAMTALQYLSDLADLTTDADPNVKHTITLITPEEFVKALPVNIASA